LTNNPLQDSEGCLGDTDRAFVVSRKYRTLNCAHGGGGEACGTCPSASTAGLIQDREPYELASSSPVDIVCINRKSELESKMATSAQFGDVITQIS
jgi:hypothetical protein